MCIRDSLKYYREEFGKESVPCTVCCSDKEVTVGNDGLVRDYFLPYDEITGAVYDSEIFCFTTKDNAYYFPLSAIPDGKDALLGLLKRKNPVSYTHLDVYKRQVEHREDQSRRRSLRHRAVDARLLDGIVRIPQASRIGHAQQKLALSLIHI